MKGISLALLTLAAVSGGQNTTSVNWMANYTEALNQTQESEKPLLVVIDNPSDPTLCAEHAGQKPDKTQAELLGSYELCRVDVTTEHGKQVAEAFGVAEFPFMAIIDKTGSGVLFQSAGKMDTVEWVENLAAYRDGEIPGGQAVGNGRAASGQTSTTRSRRTKTARSACYT
jgi:hypothetical protein